MTDQHSAFYLSLCLVILETVKDQERPKSARHNRLSNVVDGVSRAVDIYRPEAWGRDDLDKACAVIDRLDVLVKEFYPSMDDHVIEYQI